MAIINKTGISNGGTIQAEHVTRVIDALSSVSTDSIVATGSFTGSFRGPLTGTASFATTASFALNAGAGAGFPFTGSAQITGSLGVTGSLTVVSSFAASGSHMNVSATDFLVTSGETYFTGSAGKGYGSVTFGKQTALNLNAIATGSGFSIPLRDTNVPTTGSMYFDVTGPTLWIYTGDTWRGWANDF
jgi:hypothetical protein